MLGRRGQFEGVADWLPVLPLWSVLLVDNKVKFQCDVLVVL